MLHILYVESHYAGAHRDWIDSYSARSAHKFTLLTMPGGDWRWRLHGGAIHLAGLFHAQREHLAPIDLVLINGMVSAPLFLACTRPHLDRLPIALYIQENQLSYPPPPDEPFLWQNGAVVQVTAAYVADMVAFNGPYLKEDFLRSLREFVDERDFTADMLERITAHSSVLRRGIDLKQRFGSPQPRSIPDQPVTFLWSHRWAYEKGVDDFAIALRQLLREEVPFQVILAGDTWDHAALKAELLAELGERVILHGLLEGQAYVDALRRADVVVACSQNEPLGVSVLEAIYMGCLPVLPARGSFPVVLPPQFHNLLYDGSVEALAARLRFLATYPDTLTRPGLVEIAAAYDWSNVTPSYDQTFSELVERYKRTS